MVALNQEDTVITLVLSSRDHHPAKEGMTAQHDVVLCPPKAF
jgi:hypothetical protein